MKFKNPRKKAFISIFAIFFSAIVVSVLTALYVLFIKQISILNLDYSSFQSLYMADSSFECALYKESQNTSTSTSVFLPENKGNLGSCENTGDTVWASESVVSNGESKSTANFTMDTDQGKFCGQILVTKEINDSATSHTMKIFGQSRDCTDATSKVIEREIDFVY